MNGYKEPQNAELSRLSAAVTTLIDEPQSHAQQIYPLVYFCGLHRKAIQIEEQAVNMMTSLLAQLLNMILDRKVDIDLTELDTKLIKDGTFSELFIASFFFAYVVRRLPKGSVVHCAVDNLWITGMTSNLTTVISSSYSHYSCGMFSLAKRYI